MLCSCSVPWYRGRLKRERRGNSNRHKIIMRSNNCHIKNTRNKIKGNNSMSSFIRTSNSSLQLFSNNNNDKVLRENKKRIYKRKSKRNTHNRFSLSNHHLRARHRRMTLILTTIKISIKLVTNNFNNLNQNTPHKHIPLLLYSNNKLIY